MLTIQRYSFALKLLLLPALFLTLADAHAENLDFGGYPDRFKGGGDKIPPQCQIDIPRAATAAFDIKWNCTDDNAEPANIKTELWIQRNGSLSYELLTSFLGFPAAAHIDEAALQTTKFSDGIPAAFKLVATDEAGNAAISSAEIIRSQDNAVSSCTLTVTTAATESSGSTTGFPAMTVSLESSSVTINQPTSTQLTVTSAESAAASPCEISDLCSNKDKISFSSNLNLTGSTILGMVTVVPGGVVVAVSGTASVDGSVLRSFDASGLTKIGVKESNVVLSCSK